jgi:predicted aconitase
MMINPDYLHIKLSQDELDILLGTKGPTLQKVMETVVRYGEALGAECLVDIDGPGHFVIPWCFPGIAPSIEMLEELAATGLKTVYPFTLDPTPPLDFENLNLEPEVEHAILEMFSEQEHYDELMMKLGLRDKDAYTCYPYQPEVGNIPKRGMILAWSESACAIFANSVLGARTNRNGAIMDLLQNIIGKTPLAGLLIDEGRQADWLVEIKTENLPNAHILGAAIGLKILSGVPFITGLDHFLSTALDPTTTDYLQEMGAMLATYSAVSLYHVENITPEAVDLGRDLLLEDFNTYIIDANALDRLLNSFPVLWDDPKATPEKCYIGCPHLSLRQIYWWADEIEKGLQAQGEDHLAVETVICTAPQVLMKFQADQGTYQRMLHAGIRFSTTCSETIFETGLYAGKPVITNSNKLRAYTSARFFPDEELVKVLVTGEMKGVNQSE